MTSTIERRSGADRRSGQDRRASFQAEGPFGLKFNVHGGGRIIFFLLGAGSIAALCWAFLGR